MARGDEEAVPVSIPAAGEEPDVPDFDDEE